MCFLSFLMMLSFLPASVSVKAEGTVDNVVITYDESQVTFTTSMTAKEATALLVKSCFRLCLFPFHHSGYLCGGEGVLPDTTARIIFSLPEDQEIEKR